MAEVQGRLRTCGYAEVFVCIQFQDKLRGMRNYSNAFIGESKNLRASSFKDHATSDMHARAMLLLKKQSSFFYRGHVDEGILPI